MRAWSVVRNDSARKRSMSGHMAKAAGALLCVEGEWVTVAQVAERLGVTSDACRKRLARARKVAGPVTWEALR